MQCDIIIPVYNAPEWVVPCVKLAIKYTPIEYLHRILLIDDGSSVYTQKVLQELATNDSRICIYTNEQNLGFVKTVNRGLALATAPYILLLNSDCFLSPNAVPKFIAHAQKEKQVGLFSPISNNSPVVTFDMFPGYSFLQMNALLEQLFGGTCVDACTIVGNCLFITRTCFENVGYFDERYGRGYGEETDYQFKALEKGFEAKIALDTYVYHKAEASFGSQPEAEEHRKQNHKLFMERWGNEYQYRFSMYQKNDPIAMLVRKTREYLQTHTPFPESDALFYLPGISQKIGGVHNVIEIINELIMNHITVTLVVSSVAPFQEMMLTQPILISEDEFINGRIQIQTKAVVATAWNTVYACYCFTKTKHLPLIYLVQGYEVFFENGINYRIVAETYRLADAIITISQWLSHNLLTRFALPSSVFPNGYNQHIFYSTEEQLSKKTPTITMVFRGSDVKGDWILQDVIQLLLKEFGERIYVNVVAFETSAWSFADESNVRVRQGPLSKQQIAEMLRQTSIFVDASLHEGFGLFPLEAMACGAVVVASDSGGVCEFVQDGVNGFLIRNVNKPESYVEKIRCLLDDQSRYLQFRAQSLKIVSTYYSTKTLQNYVQFFSNIQTIPIAPKDKLCSLNKAYRERYYLMKKEEIQLPRKKISQCFIGSRFRFSEKHSIMQPITGKEKYLEFDLTPYQYIDAFRFDPINDSTVLKLPSAKIIMQDGSEHLLSEYVSNACYQADQQLVFITNDPQIYWSIPCLQHPQILRIELEFIAIGDATRNYLPPYWWLRWRHLIKRYYFLTFKIRQWLLVRSVPHEN